MDDSAIIELFFARSEQAIRKLDSQYGKTFHNLSYSILNSRQDAEECVNDAYLGAWNAIPPAWPSPLLAFVCKIVRNHSLILCKSQSRFTRDMELVEKYIHGLFPIWGIRFIAVADNADTEVKGNKKACQINGLVNEWYLEDLSENVRMVFDLKRREGQYIGGFPIYGYKKGP